MTDATLSPISADVMKERREDERRLALMKIFEKEMGFVGMLIIGICASQKHAGGKPFLVEGAEMALMGSVDAGQSTHDVLAAAHQAWHDRNKHICLDSE